MDGGERNLVLARCAAILFACAALSSLPALIVLSDPDPPV